MYTDTEHKQFSWCSNTCVHRYRTQAVIMVLKYLCTQIQNTSSSHGAQILVYTDTEHKQFSRCSNTCVHSYRTQAVLTILTSILSRWMKYQPILLTFLTDGASTSSLSLHRYLLPQTWNDKNCYKLFHCLPSKHSQLSDTSLHTVQIKHYAFVHCNIYSLKQIPGCYVRHTAVVLAQNHISCI